MIPSSKPHLSNESLWNIVLMRGALLDQIWANMTGM